MTPRVVIRSHLGNVVIGILGFIYLVSALGLFGWHLVDTWGAASLIDRLIYLVTLGAALVGAWFIYLARTNLGAVVQPRAG